MRGDSRYLQRHGQQWRVRLKVPLKAQAVIGSTHVMVPLRTDSLAKANLLKHDVVADLKRRFAAAERQATMGSADPLIEEGAAWRDAISLEKERPAYGHGPDDAPTTAAELLLDRVEELTEKEGPGRAKVLYDMAYGRATPISTLVDAWLAEARAKPRQEADHRRAVERFMAWSRAAKEPGTVEGTTRKVAGRYIREAFVETHANAKTTNKYISTMSVFWKWLIKRGHATENPWLGQGVSKKRSEGPGKRPFTDAEVVTLLNAKADAALADTMRIAALSGMRIEEIARLTVADCRAGVFDIRSAKTKAGIRKVPIHPDLAHVVSRRTKGKEADAFLIHEERAPPPDSKMERSMTLVKRFKTLRTRVGVDQVVEGERQSLITFHSFRRWFITAAERAGQPVHVVEAVVGHRRPGMTLGVYSGGPAEQQMRAVVEAVRLPAGVA
ncbi:MAG: tyrosine-type recombinase/integrase [Rhizobiales bacterium]|nr:tyrosine-type recombinase/integrase [Hyphomicrobiales bacterium]